MEEIALLVAFLALVLAILAVYTASTAQTALRQVERKLRALGREPDAGTIGVVEDLVERRRAVRGPTSAAALRAEFEVAPEPVAATTASPPTPAGEPETEPQPVPVPAPVTRSLEERLGASLPIWFGALALALAGVFLVKHFADRGLLGPAARVGIAVVFGIALLILAMRVRVRRPAIAQGLAAAGVAVLSGATYAATALYGFLSPLAGVGVQGVVTAIAVAASLRFGPFVALLGLVGGFVIPGLVGPGEIEAGAMFGYLTLLQIALAAIGRQQGWWWVPVLGAVGAFAWAATWQALRMDGASWVSGFAFTSALIAVHATRGVSVRLGGGLPRVATAVPWLVTGAAIAVLMQDLVATAFAAEHWAWTGAVVVGTLVLASRDREMAGLPWLAAAAVGVRLLWLRDPDLWTAEGSILPVHAWAIAGYGVLFGVGPHLAAAGRNAQREVLAWLPPVAVFVALRAAELANLPTVIAGALAVAVTAALAVRTRQRGAPEARAEREAGLWSATLLAAGCVIYDSVGPDWRVAVLAFVPVAAATLCLRLALPRLGIVALVLTAGVIALVLPDHGESAFEIEVAFWNPASLAVLATTMSAVASSRILHVAHAASRVARAHQTVAVALAAATLFVWNAQVFEVVDLERPAFLATAWLTVAWLVLGQALFWTAPRWAIPGRSRPGSHLTLLGLFVLVVFCGGLFDPLLVRVTVGSWPVLNGILLAFGGGGVLALLAARGWKVVDARRRSAFAAVVAFACGFALVSLEVRQAFQGEVLSGALPDRAEWYSYSAAWLLYGAVLLAVGVVRDQRPLRYASLLVVLAAVLKVFLFDASNLDGLWRVLSFFGLGVALIGLAWVYQRFVVGRGDQGVLETG